MKSVQLRLLGLISAVGLAAFFIGATPVGAAAAVAGTATTCTGGSVAAGKYSSLVIAGACAIDSGSVLVRGNLTVTSTGELLAAFGGSDLTVHESLYVQKKGVLVLGCEPQAFTCFNDDPNNPTMSTNDKVGDRLVANEALAVLVHHNTIGEDVILRGGGGGVNCNPRHRLFGSPAYATFEDNAIGGEVSITGWDSCWLGFIRNTSGDVTFSRNVVADPDGNEVVTNTISGDLRCSGNSPAPQIGDSGGALNTVSGHATGQCIGLTT
jgi:hypothetical protein